MRRLPPPLRVTRPPPSSTTRRRVLITLAVAVITIVTGLGPQLKVMMPPAATARTTAAEVQLAGLPFPITWLGWLVSTARPARRHRDVRGMALALAGAAAAATLGIAPTSATRAHDGAQHRSEPVPCPAWHPMLVRAPSSLRR